MNTTPTKPRAAKRPEKTPSPVGGRLKEAIAASGLSAYELARQSGVNVAAVLRFKSGERGLTLDSADRLAVVLGLELCPVRPSPK